MKLAIFVTAVWLVFICAAPAYAYVDPGSGGMMLQLLLGGVAGAAVIVRLYWQRLLKRIGLRKPDQEP
jgi:Flp pilus assembly protein TadB